MALKSARIVDFCRKSSGFADFENTVDRRSAVNFGAVPDYACLDVRILSPTRNLDHRSFFSLGRYVNEFSQIISFCERRSFKLRCENVIGIVLCYSHQACCLLYYLSEINNGITLLHCCFRMWLWFRIWTRILVDRRILAKKGTDRRICISLFTGPLISTCMSCNSIAIHQLKSWAARN